MSLTVTRITTVVLLPLASVTVYCTGCVPTFPQSKTVYCRLLSAISQLSLLPSSMSSGLREALPAASR
ncbi:hypothetical protein D9M68_879340 [compost metagenome]